MIKDPKGRKWFMHFRQYQNGWHWEAGCGNAGQAAGQMFATKALAKADAISVIQGHDAIAEAGETFRRV
jgi:hypothetical protein